LSPSKTKPKVDNVPDLSMRQVKKDKNARKSRNAKTDVWAFSIAKGK
jgi:hypothetical protein